MKLFSVNINSAKYDRVERVFIAIHSLNRNNPIEFNIKNIPKGKSSYKFHLGDLPTDFNSSKCFSDSMHICVIVVPKGRCIKTFKIDIDAVDIVDMNGRKGKGVYFPNIDIDTESTISTVFTNSDIITTFFN